MHVSRTLNPVTVLQTKLYQPQIGRDFIQRPQLIEYLNQGLTCKLTLITGPAGYGKTTIATQWLARLDETQGQMAPSVAWLSLDEYDDDLLPFIRYVVAAIQTVCPDFGGNILDTVLSPHPPPWQHLADMLANEFAQMVKPLALTLDDYHVISRETIHQLLDRLLDHLPPSMHLVLISRTEPPLALGRLRVRRQVIEVRGTDLSFSLAETTRFVTKALGKTPVPKTLQALQASSEGWIAGLQLAILSHPRRNDTYQRDETALLRHFQNHKSHATDYLFEEVLALQPQTVQSFLLQTSILDRFCASLCQAILGPAWLNQVAQDEQLPNTITSSPIPAQMLFEWLGRANLFLIPLDGAGIWYRYHHLFQKMLGQTLAERMSANDIAALHRQASLWLASEDLIEEALHQAVAAEDVPLAIQLVEQNRVKLLDQFDFYTLERWLALLPETAIEQRPALLLLRGWISTSTYRMESSSAFHLAQRAEACLANPDIAIDRIDRCAQVAEIAALRAMGWYWRGAFQQALYYALPVIEEFHVSPAYIRTTLVSLAAFALQAVGQPAAANELIEQELDNEDVRLSLPGIQLAAWLPYLHCMAGHLQEAMDVAHDVMSLTQVRAPNNAFVKATLFRWLGYVYYEWNELEKATEQLTKVEPVHTGPFYNSQLNLAWIHVIQDQTKEVKEVITRLRRDVLDTHVNLENGICLNGMASFQARYLHWQGEIDLAAQQLHGVALESERENFLNVEVPLFTQVRILIDQKQDEGWREAERLLREKWSQAEKTHNVPHQIKILALEALLYQRQGNLEEALAALERSVTLAKPGGFIRTFVDLGAPVAQLLQQLLAHGFEPDYLGQILAAFPATQVSSQATLPPQPVQPPQLQQTTTLIEPLTARELEVLTLLSDRLSNKEIAQVLAISPFTVKNHLSTIYQKLGVTGRRQAVTKARNLGLLP